MRHWPLELTAADAYVCCQPRLGCPGSPVPPHLIPDRTSLITAPLPCPRRLPLHSAGDLLQQRASVAANVRRLVAGFREAEAADKAAAAMPSYGSTVTVMSESQVGGCRMAGSSLYARGLPACISWGYVLQQSPLPHFPEPLAFKSAFQPCHKTALLQKLMQKLERKAQRRATGRAAGGSSAGLAELGDADADWVRWVYVGAPVLVHRTRACCCAASQYIILYILYILYIL